MGRSIDELLNDGQPEPEAEVSTAPEPTAEEPVAEELSGPPRDEHGRFAPKQTGVEEEPAAEPQVPVPPTEQSQGLPREEYSALRAIREENKELKRQMEAFMRQQMQPPAQPQFQQPTADFWEDPHGYMSQQFNQFGQTLLQQWEQRQTAARVDQSEKAARARHQDYDDAFRAFEEAVQANPRLAVELAQSDDPGEFAYQRGKTALTLQSVGSLEAYEAQLRAKWEAEAKAAFQQPAKPVLPSTTAADGSVGARSGPAWSGPKPIDELLR